MRQGNNGEAQGYIHSLQESQRSSGSNLAGMNTGIFSKTVDILTDPVLQSVFSLRFILSHHRTLSFSL